MSLKKLWIALLTLLALGATVPAPVWAVGGATAEVDQTLGLEALRQETGLTGAGVTVGIVGEGIANWQSLVPSGDLPSDIQSVDGDEGNGLSLAHLQVIHDVAPGARLVFCENDGIDIPALLDLGAQIILFMDTAPYTTIFEDRLSEEARDVANSGVLVVAPAGDYGAGHYRATFTDSGNGEHDFGGGVTRLAVQVPAGCFAHAAVDWADPLSAPSYSDYRMHIYDSIDDPTYIDVDAGSYPMAAGFIGQYDQPWTFYLAAGKLPEAAVLPFDVRVQCDYPGPAGGLSTTLEPAYRVEKGSIIGVGALAEVLTVGALDDTTVVARQGLYATRSYSGRGPAEITIPGTEIRPKPDLMAPDCQSQYVYTGESYVQCGTSVSAAVVAGIAALIQEKRAFTRTRDIKELLTGTAADLGEGGFDSTTGWGQVDARAAIELPPVPAVDAAHVLLACLTAVALAISSIGRTRA
ncbi:MAG: S8 family serine peptidase [Candidatus Schekmanbacteria bacterium]|nr:S8 family serine peptidase [Candidatus Schekmanbacteria bacterium]